MKVIIQNAIKINILYQETFEEVRWSILSKLVLHPSSFPQPQTIPFSFIFMLLPAQVPSNSPSFFANIFMAIPANANASNTMDNKSTFIL